MRLLSAIIEFLHRKEPDHAQGKDCPPHPRTEWDIPHLPGTGFMIEDEDGTIRPMTSKEVLDGPKIKKSR
jgi:hypothetical protein